MGRGRCPGLDEVGADLEIGAASPTIIPTMRFVDVEAIVGDEPAAWCCEAATPSPLPKPRRPGVRQVGPTGRSR